MVPWCLASLVELSLASLSCALPLWKGHVGTLTGVFTHPEYSGAMTPDLAAGKQGGIQQMSTQGMVWDLCLIPML